ncbi:Helix-turn-helix [Megamonas hypermegale ART12/1]|nr:Helix-turn-helix [Megamonas hypermegale ART12/1]
MELAQETNISLSYMAKIESGLVTGCVSLPVLYKISKILDVSLDKLVNKN